MNGIIPEGSGEVIGATIAPTVYRRGLTWLGALFRETTGARSFRGRVSLTMATSVALGVIGLVTGVLSARLLGPGGRGELAAIQTWPLVLSSLSLLGLPEAMIYYTSRNPGRAGGYLGATLVMTLAAGAVATLAGWWLLPWLLKAQTPGVVFGARVYLAVIGVTVIAAVPHQALRAHGAWRSWNALRIGPGACWLLVLLAAFWFPRLARPFPLSLLSLVATSSTLIPLWVILRRHSAGPSVPPADCFGPLLRYGLPAMLSVLPQTLNLRLDQMLMTAFLEPESLGLYVAAVAWSGLVMPLVNSVGSVLFPHLSAIPDRDRQRATLLRLGRRFGAVILALTAVLLAVTPVVLPVVFGPAFKAAIPAAMVLVAAGGFGTLNTTLEAALQGLGRPSGVLVAEAVGLGVTVALLSALLVRFGIVGAAVASLFAYATTTALLVVQIARVLRRDVAEASA